jgi:predicted permease
MSIVFMNTTDGIFKDFGYALRSLRRAPVFTAAAVLSLALGIGGNTAIFSLIDQVLLRALPVPNPQELVIVKSPGMRTGHVSSDEAQGAGSFSYPMYQDLRDKQTGFAGLLARYGFSANIAFGGQAQPGSGELVSGNYFDVLKVRPALGRLIFPQDAVTPGGSPVVVLSHSLWLKQFAGRADILNRQVVVNGRSLTVVGVTPAEFFGTQLGQYPDVYVPMTLKAEMTPNWNGLDSHDDYWLNIIGRLKPGTTLQQAQAQLGALYRPLLNAEADVKGMKDDRRAKFVGKPIVLESGSGGRRLLSNSTRQPLLVLMAMVGLVLLIACANVANLLVARASARERETAVRLAIGASRARLIRQCIAESLTLAGGGAVAGLFVAYWTVAGLLRLMPGVSGVSTFSAAINVSVLLFTFALAVATGFIFGLLPALESTRIDLAGSLKSGIVAAATSYHARLRKTLVAAQVAFTLLMIVGAGLFGKTLLKLYSVDLGIKAENIVRFRIAPDLNGYKTPQIRDLYQRLQVSLRAIPGVGVASMATVPIFADSDRSSNVTIEGYTPARDESMDVARNDIGSAYFATLGVPLISGREFEESDTANSAKVCIINQATADRFFKGRDPVGYHIAFGAGDRVVPDMQIVGVVQNSKHSTVDEEPLRFIYTPYTQARALNQIIFYVRSAVPPASLMNTIRAKVGDLDPSLPVANMKTLATQIDESLGNQRLMSLLSIAFGAVSVLLAGFGIYSVMSYLVSRRTREIGIRVAIGAAPSLVRWMIVREILVVAGIGILIGLPLSFVLGKSAQALLYGMNGIDLPTTLFAITAIILLALAAGFFPARRATRIDPVVALRQE